jgi:hypothetical protein
MPAAIAWAKAICPRRLKRLAHADKKVHFAFAHPANLRRFT